MQTLTNPRTGKDVPATRITCDCGAPCCQGVTILVPATMLAKGSKRTVTHNLVARRKLFGYPEV